MKLKLAHPPQDPPLHEVRKQIEKTIDMHNRSARESDGVIRDESVIYEIGCLQKALQLLPRR